ncbi:YlxM family DNA-binding protein [Cellulosilyticum sp. I15G10I2]|uniref:YlxM family DNA-binding protein n=1 Tax=Cellulosilyticum sp. I15G10I2 TaxID=1892843 RepID=UPI00085BE890|nr:YlxM family DNA-binding protein [Cellulosilyticum sp. I15G10I2]
MEKFVVITYLFDFYQELLTSKQKDLLKGYYFENFSLGELSDEHQISRQSVFDTIKKAEQKLLDYEQKLHLFSKHQEEQLTLIKIKELCENIKHTNAENNNEIQEIITLVEGLINTI